MCVCVFVCFLVATKLSSIGGGGLGSFRCAVAVVLLLLLLSGGACVFCIGVAYRTTAYASRQYCNNISKDCTTTSTIVDTAAAIVHCYFCFSAALATTTYYGCIQYCCGRPL